MIIPAVAIFSTYQPAMLLCTRVVLQIVLHGQTTLIFPAQKE